MTHPSPLDSIPVPEAFRREGTPTWAEYQQQYTASITNPDTFWAAQAERLEWSRRWHTVKNTRFSDGVNIRWFEGGQLNVAVNCLDRHLAQHSERTAIIWEGDNPAESRHITYGELHREVCQLANVLESSGVKKGDRVTLYLPMIPQAAAAMLACARIGAIHSVVFGGFSAEALRSRIEDCGSTFLITADEGRRGGKSVPLKANVDAALAGGSSIRTVLTVRHTGGDVAWQPGRDVWYHEALATAAPTHQAQPMDAEDPLFILYTSGSTGKPKGVLHTTAGYLLYAAFTHETVFDLRPGDVYWCTADVGWVTGHSYVVYGPLANGGTTLMFEGVPNYPDVSRFWQVVDKHKVNILYTAPTAIRSLMREGDAWLESTSRASLRVLASVGEPINPEAWLWYFEKVGQGRCPVVDTWWQTETGGHMIAPLPGAFPLKPGSATFPFYGVQPVLLDAAGHVQEGAGEGMLCIADSWPGQARSVFGDHARFEVTYFSQFPGYYFTGDGARRDEDGYYWITGRVDDVINVSGHRFGTAEIESALAAHAIVSEAAVVGFPHDIKGQGICAFVTLDANATASPNLHHELAEWVKKEIGPIAKPDSICIVSGLPKTRSGKIMRRILRKIAEGEPENIGDTSTLLDPGVVDEAKKAFIANKAA